MKYGSRWDGSEQQWVAGEVAEHGDRLEARGYFKTQAEAEAMVLGLETATEDCGQPKVPETTAVVHSSVGAAELRVSFDGPSVRITVGHSGDGEVALTRLGFDRMLSMLGAMSRLHFR